MTSMTSPHRTLRRTLALVCLAVAAAWGDDGIGLGPRRRSRSFRVSPRLRRARPRGHQRGDPEGTIVREFNVPRIRAPERVAELGVNWARGLRDPRWFVVEVPVTLDGPIRASDRAFLHGRAGSPGVRPPSIRHQRQRDCRVTPSSSSSARS